MSIHTLSILFFILYSLLVGTDILTGLVPQMGRVGTAVWIFNAALLAGLALALSFRLIYETKKHPLTIIVLAVWLCAILFNLRIPYNLSGETTLEIGCYLKQASATPDMGYRDTCMFGYPSKQYLVPALPSILFGNSMLMLHVGGSLYFILGLLFFTYGILRYLDNGNADFICSFLLASLFHIHYVGHFLLFFEQSIFPLSFGLAMVGIFLLYIKEKGLLWLSLFGFILELLIFSYTPSLALYFLALATMVTLLITTIPKRHKLLLIFYILSSLTALAISLTFRHDLQFSEATTTVSMVVDDFLKGMYHVFIYPLGVPMVSGWIRGIFLGMLGMLLLYRQNRWFRFILLWVIGVLTLAAVSKGYTYYAIGFRFHRAMIIFPVLFGSVVVFLRDWNMKIPRLASYILILIYLGTGLLYLRNTQGLEKGAGRGDQYGLVLRIAAYLRQLPGPHPTKLVILGDPDRGYISTGDLLAYFIPAMTQPSVDTESCPNPDGRELYVINTSSYCFRTYRDSLAVPYRGDISDGKSTYGIFSLY